MKLELRLASALLSVAALSLVACGGSTNPAAPADASTDGSKDGGKPDGTMTDSGDAGAGDAAPLAIPTGTLLVPSDQIQLLGVTADGYAIYAEVTTAKVESIYAVSVAGGSPKKIVDLITTGGGEFSYSINPNSNVVLTFPGLSKLGVGQVHVWTAAGDDHLLANLSYFLSVSVSSDGKSVMYANNVTTNGLEGDIYVAGTDGSNPTALVKGISLQGACAPVAGFSGSYVVASYCSLPQASDGGAPEAGEPDGGAVDAGSPDAGPATVATLSNFASPGWTQTTMLTNLPLAPKSCGTAATMANGQSILTSCGLWSGDKGGTRVALATASGDLQVLPLPTGAPIMVDTLGPNAFDFFMRPDGMGVLYTTSTKALKSSPLPAAAPKMLATGIGGITQLSPDNNYVLYYDNRDSTTGIQDLYMTSTSGGTPVTLASTMNAITFAVDFTTDSKYATWYANALQLPVPSGASTSPGLVGDLTTTPVAGGKNNTVETVVWSNLSAAGSKVVFQDNYAPFINPPSPGLGIADILSVDVSGSATAKLICAQADATGAGGPFLTAAGDQIIYTFSRSGAGAGDAGAGPDAGPDLNGLYVVPVP